jgi:hypothetical protein
VSAINPNPNEPRYPYGGGSDNPGDNTSYTNPGGPTDVQAVETGAPPTAVLHPPIVVGVAQGGTDTILPAGMQAVPPSNVGSLESTIDRGKDTGGVTVDPVTGDVRVPGQDEVQGEMETTTGITPPAFPEPNP